MIDSAPLARSSEPPSVPHGGKLAALAVLAVFWLSLAPPFDYDVWFDVRMGEQIVTTLSVPHTESFLGTQEQFGNYWSPNDEWGFCVGTWLVYRLGGPTGLAVAMAAGLAAMFGVLWASCRRVGLPPWACALWLALGYHLMRSRFMPRPQLFTDLMLAILVWFLLRGERRPWPWIAFPFFVLWANVHAGFAAGLVVLGVWAVLGRDRNAAIALGLACLAPLLTPGNVQLYVYVYRHFFVRTRDMNVLLEWQPLGREWWLGWGGLFVLISVAGFALARRKALLPHLALWALMLLFAARHSRALGELVSVTLPLVAAAWAPRVRDSRLLNGVVAALLVLSMALKGVPDLTSRGVYPEGALARLKQVDGTVLASYHFGGWLTLQRVRPFVHGMQPWYPPELLTDYLTILDDPTRGQELLRKYRVKALLLHYSPLNDAHTRFMERLANDPSWSLVYWDDVCLLYLPSPQPEAYRAVAPALPNPFPGDLRQAGQELDRKLREDEGCATAWRLRAELANREGQPERALQLFEDMQRRFPTDGRAWLGAGATLFQLDRLPEAEAALREAVRLGPRSATAWYNLALVLTARLRKAANANQEAEARALLKPARAAAEKAVGLDPTLPAAAQLLRDLQSVR